MPEFITVTNRLGKRTLVNIDHISCVADEENPEYSARIDLIAGGDDYIYTKEDFNTICQELYADRIKRQDAIQSRPRLLNEDRTDTEMAAYARGWNAAVSQYLAEIQAIGRPELQELPAEE